MLTKASGILHFDFALALALQDLWTVAMLTALTSGIPTSHHYTCLCFVPSSIIVSAEVEPKLAAD